MTQLTNLSQKGVIGEDREHLLKKYRDNNLNSLEKKKEQWKSNINLNQKRPISPALIEDFKDVATESSSEWIESISFLKKVDWQARTLKLLCGSNESSNFLRECVLKMLRGSGRGVTRYSFLIHIKKRINGKEVEDVDKDCLYQVPILVPK